MDWTLEVVVIPTHQPMIRIDNPDVVYKTEREKFNAMLDLQRQKALMPKQPTQTQQFVNEILDEMTGLGPLEPLLKDPSISDILINGHEATFVERGGLLEPVACRFKDEAHLLRIINKIVSAVGRRVDESSPICDARLPDGNVVLTPSSLAYETMTLDDLVALLDRLEIDRAHLVGLSLGGMIAAWTAISHPERVDKVVMNTGTLARPDAGHPD